VGGGGGGLRELSHQRGGISEASTHAALSASQRIYRDVEHSAIDYWKLRILGVEMVEGEAEEETWAYKVSHVHMHMHARCMHE